MEAENNAIAKITEGKRPCSEFRTNIMDDTKRCDQRPTNVKEDTDESSMRKLVYVLEPEHIHESNKIDSVCFICFITCYVMFLSVFMFSISNT